MAESRPVIAHLTTVDLSLRYLLFPQLLAPLQVGIRSVGISSPGPWVAELDAAGVEHVPLTASTRGMSLGADLRAAAQLWRVLRRLRPDVLHTHNPKPGLYGRVLGRLAGVPIVVNTVHGFYASPDDPLGKRILVYGLEAFASRFSDAELFQSSEDLALARRLRLAPPGRSRHLGNGVDLTRFDPARFDASHRRRTRAELGIPEDAVVVGMVGRLVAEKGYPELFEAARSLDDRYVVVCIGPRDPDKADDLGDALIERARAGGVRFLGMRTDVDALYPMMDLFVLPSHREGFPRAAMEAAAMGLPIVATDIRGCREVVVDGHNGLLVPVADPEALAEAIRRIGEDPDLAARMGKAGRERAERCFDERRVVDVVLSVYRELALAKGLDRLAGALGERGSMGLRIRPAEIGDAPFLGALHRKAIATGFLPRLGGRFMTLLYRALVSHDDAVVLVAEDGSGPVGFVAGVADLGAFYRYFVRRFGLSAVLAASPNLLRPSVLRRAWETLRYDGGDVGVKAELVSMAVVSDRRGRGIATELGRAFLAEMARNGEVKVVVGAGNHAAISAYQKMGFEPAGTIEVHRGETSEVLVWTG